MSEKYKYKNLVKDTGIFAIGNFGTKIISFLFVSLYTSCLSTAEFGYAEVLTTTITLLLPVFTLDISEAVLRFLYDKNINKKHVYTIGFLFTFVAIVISVLATYFACNINMDLTWYSGYFVGIFSLATIEAVLSNILKGNGKTKQFAAKGIIYTFSFVMSNIIFLTVLKIGLSGYFYSYIIAYSIADIFMFFSSDIYRIGFDFHINKILLRQMLAYSLPFIPASIAWWINSSADKYMIVWIIGADANGLYGVAHKIPTMLTAVTGIFTQAWQLSAMKNYKDKDFSNYFSEVFQLISVLLLLGCSAVFLVNKILAIPLFRNDFYDAWKYVPMLTTAAVFSTLAGFFASVFTSAKKTKILFVSTTIGAVFNVFINFFLINWIGALGAAVATAISFMIMVLTRLITMKKIVTLHANLFKIFFCFLLLFVSAIFLPYLNDLWYYFISVLVLFIILVLNFKETVSVCKIIVSKIHKEIKV